MATLSITIKDELVPRVMEGYAGFYHYQETINGAPNPESKNEFVKRMLKEHVKACVIAHEKAAALEALTI